MNKNKRFLFVLLICLSIIPPLFNESTGYYVSNKELTQPMKGIEVLILVDNGYSHEEYIHTRTNLEYFGCNITMTAMVETVMPQGSPPVNVDLLVPEVDISNYDCLFIPGGGSPGILVTKPLAINLVQDAYNEDLIIAAICQGPLVLAEADIINGRNISGFIDIKDQIEAAGATYINTGIAIDGPFVTADYYFAKTFHIGIVKALGYYETDKPEFHSITTEVDIQNNTVDLTIRINTTDLFGLSLVKVIITRTAGGPAQKLFQNLDYDEDEEIFKETISSQFNGTYSIDLELKDKLENSVFCQNITTFNVEFFITKEASAIIFWFSFATLTISALIIRYKKKK